MNVTQQQLISILNSAIHNKKVNIDIFDNINWAQLLEYANEHKVEALIYSSISKESLNNLDIEVGERLKKNTFLTAIKQLQHIKQVEKVLSVLNKENICVIVLKGIVLRSLYPNPDLRTMSDGDILVYEKDLEHVKNIMLSLGYSEFHNSPSHTVYVHKSSLPIEVHWTLADEHFFEKISEFEKEVWMNLEEVYIGESRALSLGLEDMVLNQCIHMAKHLVYKGFGVRHLCDLVLLVEKKGHMMNWDRFRIRSKEYGIEKFTVAVFMICNRFFAMKVPSELYDDNFVKDNFLDLLIEDIFSSGVHGKNDIANLVANELAYTSGKLEGKSTSIMKRFMLKIFPRIDDMSDKYNYAKKVRVLAPFAWIHHLFAGIFNKEYSFKEKINVMTTAVSISKQRNKLIDWLEL